MTVSSSFRINQYNWFGQKLLVQHRYDELLQLRRCLSCESDVVQSNDTPLRPPSDHLIYTAGLALMKTSTRVEEVIYMLQNLNFQKNSQYFLFLCQCLLYLGNHDAVVALFKQTLNRELPAAVYQEKRSHERLGKYSNESIDDLYSNQSDISNNEKFGWCSRALSEESVELKTVRQNHLISDPRLWFIFALCLEYQMQFENAEAAYRVACKLSCTIDLDGYQIELANANQPSLSPPLRNFYTPLKMYSEFCIRYRSDYRMAVQILGLDRKKMPKLDCALHSALALTLSSQPNSNTALFSKALELINSLDNQSLSLRNPSAVYNSLALKCKQKLNYQNTTRRNDHDSLKGLGGDQENDLNFALIKSHIVINEIIQNSPDIPNLYNCPELKAPTRSNILLIKNKTDQIFAQIDKVVDALRLCNPDCWTSPALWNNLGICYLIKRRYIASLSCLAKAHQISPTDWRINYNLALIYLHAGLPLRALCSSLASKNNLRHQQPMVLDSSITNTLIAVSYSDLIFVHEARRFYTEMIAAGRDNGLNRTLLLTLINYLLLLHRINSQIKNKEERDLKSVTRILDLVEQVWLQRNPNDSQFSHSILELAKQIGDAQQGLEHLVKKAYAWTKFD